MRHSRVEASRGPRQKYDSTRGLLESLTTIGLHTRAALRPLNESCGSLHLSGYGGAKDLVRLPDGARCLVALRMTEHNNPHGLAYRPDPGAPCVLGDAVSFRVKVARSDSARCARGCPTAV